MNRVFVIMLLCMFIIIPIVFISKEMTQSYPIDYEQLSDDERIVIRFSHVVGENTPKGMAARKFAELIKERSKGKIEVQVFSNGTLYKDDEEMTALKNGDIQLIAPATAKLTYLVPELSVFDLPYAFYTLDEVHEFAFSETGMDLMKKLEEHNLKVVGLWDSGFKQLSNNIRPIEHYSDLEGIKIRIMPSDVLEKQFYLVGAIPKRIEFNTVFNQLQKGNVNAQENTLTNIMSKNLHSLQNYLTITNHGYLGYYLLFNLEFWNSLPKEIQTLLKETLDEVQKWEWELTKKMDAEKMEEIARCNCIQSYYFSEEEKKMWEEKFQPVYDYYEKQYGSKFIKALIKTTRLKRDLYLF